MEEGVPWEVVKVDLLCSYTVSTTNANIERGFVACMDASGSNQPTFKCYEAMLVHAALWCDGVDILDLDYPVSLDTRYSTNLIDKELPECMCLRMSILN